MMMMLSKSYCIEFCLRRELFIQTQSLVERKLFWDRALVCNGCCCFCHHRPASHLPLSSSSSSSSVVADFQFEKQLNHLAFHMVFTHSQFVFSTSFSKCLWIRHPHLINLCPRSLGDVVLPSSICTTIVFPSIYQYSDGSKHKCLFTFTLPNRKVVGILIH